MNSTVAERPARNATASPDRFSLSDLTAEELPRLEVLVRNGQHEIIAHIEAPLTALIVSPVNRVLYLEAACTSDSGAHALMGSVSDARGSVEFRFYRSGEIEHHIELFPPEAPRVSDTRLAISGWHRHLHHVAMLDRSGDLLLAPDDQTLWRKLREKMTCPTLEEWGGRVMPEVHKSGLLLECEAYGIPDGFRAFVLAPEAQNMFDGIIGAFVRLTQGFPTQAVRFAHATHPPHRVREKLQDCLPI